MNTDIPFMQRLAALMKLAPETSEADMLAALEKIIAGKTTPDPNKFVPIEALQEARMERNTDRARMSEERAVARVTDAMQRGYLSPGNAAMGNRALPIA